MVFGSNIWNKKEGMKFVEHVKFSFDRVREDIDDILHWLRLFHQKHEEHEIRLKLVESQLSYMPKTPADIKNIIDQFYSHEHLLNRVRVLHEKVDSIADLHKPLHRRIDEVENSLYTMKQGIREPESTEPIYKRIKELHDKLENMEKRAISVTNAPRAQMREKMVDTVTKQSKNYVKNVILSLIQKYGNISGIELKTIVVDEQGLCSRSSFYRLLSEIETEHPININWKGKEKHYAATLVTQIQR